MCENRKSVPKPVIQYQIDAVRKFHEAAGIHNPAYPMVPKKKRRKLRRKLIKEEHKELRKALKNDDLVGIADGGADLIVVIIGTMLEYGIPFEKVMQEVNRANFDKIVFGEVRLRDDGKVLKPEGWEPPGIAGIINDALGEEVDEMEEEMFKLNEGDKFIEKDDSELPYNSVNHCPAGEDRRSGKDRRIPSPVVEGHRPRYMDIDD